MSKELPSSIEVRDALQSDIENLEASKADRRIVKAYREYLALHTIQNSPKAWVELYYRYQKLGYIPRGVAAVGALYAFLVSPHKGVIEAFYEGFSFPIKMDSRAMINVPAWIIAELLFSKQEFIAGGADDLAQALSLKKKSVGFEKLSMPARDLGLLDIILVEKLRAAQLGRPITSNLAVSELVESIAAQHDDGVATGYSDRSIQNSIRRVRRAMHHLGVEPVKGR